MYRGGWDHPGPSDLAGFPPGLGGFWGDVWNGAKQLGGTVWDVVSGGNAQPPMDPWVLPAYYPDPSPPIGGYSWVTADTPVTSQGEPWWRYVLRTAGAAALAALIRELGPAAWQQLPPDVQREVTMQAGGQLLAGIPSWVLWGAGGLIALRVAKVI